MEQELIDRYEDLMESDQSDAEVQYQLGLCYLRGIGVEKDAQAAERWLRRAADQNHAEAIALLRRAEERPEAQLSPVTEETLPDWCERAEDGDAEAQYQVAKYLSEQNADAAAELESYLSAAVEQGHPMACLLLARQVRDSDPQRAAELLANASDCGIAEAMQELAECYAQGRGVRQDPQKAERWFVQAAEVSGAQAMLHLALRYEQGDGIAKNLVKSKAWLSRAKKAGMQDPEAELARLREARIDELLKAGQELHDGGDYPEAVKRFQWAAELGSPEAMKRLGECCYMGLGVRQDAAIAAEWYTRAAETGGLTYMADLAARYATGFCIPQSDGDSQLWLDRAAAVDREQAMERFDFHKKDMGECVRKDQYTRLANRGVEKYNSHAYAEAAELLQQAAELGSPQAMEYLGICCYFGEGMERDTAAAAKWYARAAEAGGLIYTASLAARYAVGFCISRSDSDSRLWLDRAAAMDRERALKIFDENQKVFCERLAQWRRQGEALVDDGREKYKSRAYEAAAELFRQAAEEWRSTDAMDWLGACYHSGAGVKQDRAASERWFLRAAELGGARDKARLAARYAVGFGVPQSDSESRLWLDRAAAEDSELARKEFEVHCKTWNDRKAAQSKAGEEQKLQRQVDFVTRRLIPCAVVILLPCAMFFLYDDGCIPWPFEIAVLICGYLGPALAFHLWKNNGLLLLAFAAQQLFSFYPLYRGRLFRDAVNTVFYDLIAFLLIWKLAPFLKSKTAPFLKGLVTPPLKKIIQRLNQRG